MANTLPALLTLLTLTGAVSLSETEPAARLVRAEIQLDGVTILKTSTSDNGSPDADQVYGYLKSLHFKPEPGFESLKVDEDAQEFELVRKGEPKAITVSIAYGGEARTWHIRLHRVPVDTDSAWQMASEDVDRLFSHRLIRRSDVVWLKDPKRTK